jgi:hypothetical protein
MSRAVGPQPGRRIGTPIGHIIRSMSPTRRPRPALRAAIVTLLAAALTALAGCGGASFDPSGPCTTDGRGAGAYPTLERLVPERFDDKAATTVDSGRSCTPAALGSLAGRGVRELRFAGGQWHLGDRSGVTMAVMSSPTGIQADWVAEFYESSARVAKHTQNVSLNQVTIGAVNGFRIETLNDETSFQTVVVWPGGGNVDVVIVASDVHEIGTRDAHDEVVDRAVSQFQVYAPA